MATCPDCRQQELEPGESRCPRCANDRTNWLVKAAELGVAAFAFVGGLVIAICTKRPPRT